MKHTIRNLAVSNVKKNRTRSILIVISVFLSALLLTVIAEFGYGTMRYNRANAGKLYGNYCGDFQRVTKEQYETMSRRSEFTAIGRSAFAAEVESKEADLGLTWVDQQSAENSNLKDSIQEGAWPEKGNELAAPMEFFAKAGIDCPEVGKTVLLSIRSSQASKYAKKEFVISGILASGEASRFQTSFQGYVSQDFYESLFPEERQSYKVNFRLDPSVEINAETGEEVLEGLASLCGVKEKNVSVNSMYLMFAYDPGTETLTACIGIALIVILVSVVVIYNIFQVGIVQKIQEYGKIKALGATKKQLKKLIFREGMALAVIGIPLGLGAGTLLASILFEKLAVEGTGGMAQAEIVPVSVFSVPALLVSAACTFVTVWLSLKRPMQVVAGISPIEAIRYQEGAKTNRAARKGKQQVHVFHMTCANLWANKKRTLTTILTMGLSCVLFVVLANMAGNIDNDFVAREQVEYGQYLLELDCTISDQAYPENNLDQVQKNNPLGKEFQEELKNIPGVTEVLSRKAFAAKEKKGSGKRGEMSGEGEMTDICVLNAHDFERYAMAAPLGVTDYEKVAELDGILFGYSYFLKENGYALGDKVRMDIQDAGNEVALEAEVVGSLGHAPATWVITEETWEKLNITGDLTEAVWIDCRPTERKYVEAAIRQLIAGQEHIEMKTYEKSLEMAEFSTRFMQTAIYAFIGIVGLIGFLNMANTVITGVVTRKRELGILQAVGMTNRQLNQMLQLEGILFSAGTAAVSLLLGCPLGYAVFQFAKVHGIYGLNQYHVPVPEILVMTGSIVLMQALLSYFLSRNLRKESLVERINYQG